MHPSVRPLLAATLAAGAILCPAGAAPAVPAGGAARPVSSRAAEAAALSCPMQLVGVTGDQHLVMRTMTNATVTAEKSSAAALSVDPLALGFYSWSDVDGVVRLRLDATFADGIPRLVKVVDKPAETTVKVTTTDMAQTSFRPRLFADSIDYRVYTVSRSGTLQRWLLTREPNGDLHFTDRLRLGSGYDNLTALQVASRLKWGGRWRDVLMATTDTGRLKEIVIPLARPTRLRSYTLATSGYAGTTGISTSFCQNKETFASLITVDAMANTATWTTVKAIHHPREAVARLRGPAGVGSDWVLHAVW